MQIYKICVGFGCMTGAAAGLMLSEYDMTPIMLVLGIFCGFTFGGLGAILAVDKFHQGKANRISLIVIVAMLILSVHSIMNNFDFYEHLNIEMLVLHFIGCALTGLLIGACLAGPILDNLPGRIIHVIAVHNYASRRTANILAITAVLIYFLITLCLSIFLGLYFEYALLAIHSLVLLYAVAHMLGGACFGGVYAMAKLFKYI